MANYSKRELKNPDVVTQELKKGFQWSANHLKTMIGLGGAFIVLGIGYSAYQYISEQSETKAQEAYFRAEKDFSKRKEAFTKFEQSTTALNSAKEAAAKSKDKKATPPTLPKVEGEQSTGDFSKDFGAQAEGMQKVVSDFPNSRAAQMAALDLSREQLKYKNAQGALDLLSKVKVKNDLLSSMVLMQMGTAQADLSKCDQAVSTWDKVLTNKATLFLKPEIHLKQALCFETLGQKQRAIDSYNMVLAEAKDSPFARSAEQYLRLLSSDLGN